MFKTYVVGRSMNADITIDHDTISRQHLEVTITNNHRFFCVDCNTTHGTYFQRNQEWKKLTQGYVERSDLIRLGEKKVSFSKIASKLMKLHSKNSVSKQIFDPYTMSLE